MAPRAFLRTRYRVKLAAKPDADHWSGGKPYHRGARCPACKIPLLLLWDLNCKDPRFPRRKFGPLTRLPLYCCWGCVNDISYQIVDEHQIRIHASKRGAGPSFQYEPYPESFERRGLVLLEGVPDEIRRIYQQLIARWDATAGDEAVPVPTRQEQKTLTEFFGHPVLLPRSFFHHQLGGRPVLDYWANEVFECPNLDCKGTLTEQMRGRKRTMKFLAGVLNDPWAGLPMVEPAGEETRGHWNYGVSVQYHICDSCWTVLGCNRSD
jgi:hypothetical protein